MKPLNVGMIGAGTIADEHMKAYGNCEMASLSAICDVNPARAREKAQRYGVGRTYADYHSLLADEAVDAVSICTPNHLHAEIALAALAAGKHVLVEKPMATNVEDANRLSDAADASGKILQIGYVRRFSPNALVLKKFIDAGELGNIYYAKASLLRSAGNPGGWFADKAVSGGGPLIDLGVHVIDLCWYLMGTPKIASVSGTVFSRLGSRANLEHLTRYQAVDRPSAVSTVEDLAGALIRFENGAALYCDTSYSLHGRNEVSVRVYGEKGGAELEPELVMFREELNTLIQVKPRIDSLAFDVAAAFQNEIDHFIGACLGQVPATATAAQGVEMARIVAAIYDSAESQQEVAMRSAIPASTPC